MSDPARILIVEDEPDTRANLCDLLQLFGFEPFAVGSGSEALAHPELTTADLIVLDRKLPDLQADELLPRIREHLPETDVIVATAHADLDGTIAALRHGAADYLIKPVNPDALRLSIERCLDRQQLRQQTRLLDKAIADLNEGVLITQAAPAWFDSKIVFVNEALANMTGYQREELAGCTPQLLEGTGTDSRVIDELNRSLAEETAATRELMIQRKDGRQLTVELHLSPVRDAAAVWTHIVATIRDISDRKLAEERALQSERLAAIGKAMTGLAHESRNALQRSQASLDMLSAIVGENGSDADAMKLIGRIQLAQDDLHRLYEDVREYARPVRVSGAEQALDECLHQAWDELIVKREGRETRLTEEKLTDDLNCVAEPFLIRQVFRNILDNALAACEDPVAITVTWREAELNDEPALQVSVRDNGPGLKVESRDKLFEEFFTTKTHGTGLGLAIVKRFVEAHSGDIAIGKTSRGLELIITLPRQ